MSHIEAWDEADRRHMRRALELAAQAGEAGEAPVGAVVVDAESGRVVSEGCNQPIAGHDPTAHAEIIAIRAAGQAVGNYRLVDLTLYVTLEPCAMCAGAISHARLGRLVFGASDEKGGAVMNGARFFDSPTCHWAPTCVGGLYAEEAAELLTSFFRARRGRR